MRVAGRSHRRGHCGPPETAYVRFAVTSTSRRSVSYVRRARQGGLFGLRLCSLGSSERSGGEDRETGPFTGPVRPAAATAVVAVTVAVAVRGGGVVGER